MGGLVIQNQAVECAIKLSSSFATGVGDGLLGLAFDAINTVKPRRAATPVQNLRNEDLVPQVIPDRLQLNNRIRIYSLASSPVLPKHLDSTRSVSTWSDQY